jgi:ATP-dependent RNA helicase DeaD
MGSSDFDKLKLSEELQKGIRKAGFTKMTPIQEAAIPLLLSGRDVIGQAQTGTGKTAAYGIPMLSKVDPSKPITQGVVLAPTRELATQIAAMLRNYAKFMDIKILCIHGGGKMQRQIALLSRATHVIVATPGRLLDLIRKRGVVDLRNAKVAVIDEADKMLEMGFMREVKGILSSLPFVRQTSLWSATISQDIIDVSFRHMRHPRKVIVSSDEIAQTNVNQFYVEVDEDTRDSRLIELLNELDVDRGLIFCNRRDTVDQLSEKLKQERYLVEPLHGGFTQTQRDVAVTKLLKRQARYLVSTDVASRGLDIKGLTHIINYEVPEDPEVYFHRIGRTARIGEGGISITLVSEREEEYLFDIKQMTSTEMAEWSPSLG